MLKYFLVLLLCSACTINTPSQGKKIGTIVKLSECGILNKTCEGELIRGGLNDGSGSFGNIFYFTIEDPQLKNIASGALENQNEVIIFYRVEGISAIWRSEKKKPAFVYDIQLKK